MWGSQSSFGEEMCGFEAHGGEFETAHKRSDAFGPLFVFVHSSL
jgi:hypothetical protein